MNCKLCNDFIYSGHKFKNHIYCNYCYDTIIQTTIMQLNTYQNAKTEISNALTLLDRVETKANKICKAVTLQESQRSASGNSTEDRVVEFCDLRSDVDIIVSINTKRCDDIESKISLMSNGRLKNILLLKYIYGQDLIKISNIEQVCYRTILREHQKALAEYAEMFLEV